MVINISHKNSVMQTQSVMSYLFLIQNTICGNNNQNKEQIMKFGLVSTLRGICSLVFLIFLVFLVSLVSSRGLTLLLLILTTHCNIALCASTLSLHNIPSHATQTKFNLYYIEMDMQGHLILFMGLKMSSILI